MIKTCVACGKEFRAQRSTAKYCSQACKKRHQRGFAMPDMPAPVVAFTMNAGEVAEVVQGAHRATDDLSRASEHTPEPLRGKLRRCAEGFADALGREGL